MTNLEWLKTRDLITTYEVYKETLDNTEKIGVNVFIKLRDSDYYDYIEKGIKWLLEEHKEKIKITEFEHDVLKAFTKLLNYEEGDRIEDFSALQALWNGGWFRNIDENLSIQEILENCEVVERTKKSTEKSFLYIEK